MKNSPLQQILLGICSREGTKNHQREEYTLMISLADPELGERGITKPPKLQEHLLLFFHDLDDIEVKAPKYAGCKKPTHKHVEAILQSFSNLKNTQAGKKTGALVHCEAGISRSTAAAILGLCSLGMNPESAFQEVCKMNPLGLPNRRMLRLGTEILGYGRELLPIANFQRKEMFAHYQQEDPIENLLKSLEKRNQTLLKIDFLFKKIHNIFLGCKDSALEKTLERWRTKVQMATIRKNHQPRKESLDKFLTPKTT